VKICKKFKKPCIFSPHGFIHTKKNYIFKIIHDLTIGKIIKNANICTALTQLDYKDYKRLGVKNEKIVDLPNGVHLEEFSKKNNKEILKFKKNFNLGNKNIISVGRLHKSKGLKYIIESIRNLDVNLIIVGKDAGYKKELEKLVEKLELKKHVIFTGPLEDKNLINAYKSCNLSVLFSEWEGFGIVAIESLAAGTPVIVSDRGALPYLIKNNENGIVVKFKDVDELKEKISELLNNNKKRENLIKNGKILAKKYSWENIVRKTEKIYSEQVKNAK
jgi:glycosyltransferase involved in cell wall biosynthesis